MTLISFYSLGQIHTSFIDVLIQNSQGIVEGKPVWRAFANRLMAPYLVHGLSLLGMSLHTAVSVFLVFAILLQNSLVYFLIRGYRNERAALHSLLLFSVLFLAFQHHQTYIWDYLEVISFTLLAWMVFAVASNKALIVLFLVALLNREGALLIALFLMINAVEWQRDEASGWWRKTAINRVQIMFSGGLLLFGVVFVKGTRDWLFVESAYSGYGLDLQHKLLGNHFQLLVNIKDLLWDNFWTADIYNSVILLAAWGFPLLFFKRYEPRHFKALLVHLAMILSVMTFGLINETRVFIALIPMLLFFYVDFCLPERASNSG